MGQANSSEQTKNSACATADPAPRSDSAARPGCEQLGHPRGAPKRKRTPRNISGSSTPSSDTRENEESAKRTRTPPVWPDRVAPRRPLRLVSATGTGAVVGGGEMARPAPTPTLKGSSSCIIARRNPPRKIAITKENLPTRKTCLVDDILSSKSAGVRKVALTLGGRGRAAAERRARDAPNPGRPRRLAKRMSYQSISLNARMYTPLSLLRAHIPAGQTGSVSAPAIETLLVNRNSRQIEKWSSMEEPPVYFERAEADAGISGGRESSHAFERCAAGYSLSKTLQGVIAGYESIKMRCGDAAWNMYPMSKRRTVPEKWWPVGCSKPGQGRQFADASALEYACKNFGGDKVFRLDWMAEEIFGLPPEALDRIRNKETSLLEEVSRLCENWEAARSHLKPPSHVPEQYLPFLTMIGPQERFLEMKLGVYYMLERKTVIKFMTKASYLPNYALETAFGLGLTNSRVKGTVGVTGICPKGFCLEMPFEGVALRDVLNGDLNCQLNRPAPVPGSGQAPDTRTFSSQYASSSLRCHVPLYTSSASTSATATAAVKYKKGLGGVPVQTQRHGQPPEMLQHHMPPAIAKGTLYGVRMLQVTGRLPASLQRKCQHPIADSYSAVGVVNTMRSKLLDEIPFVLVEIANIVTRLSQQGLVNPDIKSDNIVVDGVTGQPKMIDFGLMIPAGKRDDSRHYSRSCEGMMTEFPQTAPEYLKGEVCAEPSMVYGLCHLVFVTLSSLTARTGDMAAASLSTNIPLCSYLVKGYHQDPRLRPRASEIAPLIGGLFPFTNKIAKLFKYPRQYLC